MLSKVAGLVVSSLVVTSCGSGGGGGAGGGGGGDGGSATTENHAPVAEAGPDQNVTAGALVIVDGSSSTDSDGDLLTYRWSFSATPPGSRATLSSTIAVQSTFVADVAGSYVISLVVNDGTVDSAADTVIVTAATQNSAPVANAGPDESVVTGTLVTLDGSASSDANGDPLVYRWSFVSRPTDSAAALSSISSVHPTFTADVDGSYVLGLVVNDGTVDSAADTVIVTAATQNSAPVANAGPDRSVATGAQVSLDASASSDADGDPLTYRWWLVSRPAGSAAELSGTTTIHPTFTADVDGSYVLGLVVNDGTVDSAADTVMITATTVIGGQCAVVQDGPGAHGVALLPDGRIVIVSGSVFVSALYRFNSDTTGGELIASFPGNARAVAVQPDGKLLVVGRSPRVPLNDPDLVVRRFDSNGIPDDTFGTSGFVFYDGGTLDGAEAVAVQPDGKILVAGFRDNSADRDVLLLRYHSNGTLDASFGTGGVVIYDSGMYDVGGNDIALQPDGKIVVVSTVVGVTQEVLLLRFRSDGQLDTSFGANGVVTSDGGAPASGEAVAVQPDGRIIVAGASTFDNQAHLLLLRYDVSGSPDPTFGNAGAVVGAVGLAQDVALQPGGRIVVAGETSVAGILFSAALVARYDGAGALDPSFGNAGTFIYDSSDGADRIEGLALGGDGLIVAAGTSSYSSPYGVSPGQLLLMRLFDVCR